MEQLEQWFREKQVERTIQALKKNNFEALYVSDSKAALEEVMKQNTRWSQRWHRRVCHPCSDWVAGCLKESKDSTHLAFTASPKR